MFLYNSAYAAGRTSEAPARHQLLAEALGFELVEDSPSITNGGRPKRWVVVRPPGATTAILLAKADGDRQSEGVGNQAAGRVGFFLRALPDEVHASLQRRAKAAGQSLQQYLATELTRLASTPTMNDVLARISRRNGGRVSLDRAVADLDEERGPR